MTEREALKLALEALKTCNWVDDGGYGHAEYNHVSTSKAITAIKEALSQPEQCRKEQRGNGEYVCNCKSGECPESAQPEQKPDDLTIAYMSGVYDGKKLRTWVGLTDDDLRQIILVAIGVAEAKLKEKNT